jgi:non-heme chloroperoxidase
MQSRTLVLKHIVLVSVAAMFFFASPSFAQMQTREVQINGLTLHYIELGQGTPLVLVHGTLGITARGMDSLRRSRRDID